MEISGKENWKFQENKIGSFGSTSFLDANPTFVSGLKIGVS